MPRILVTGYGGFLGQSIVRKLLASGISVRGLARNRYPRLTEIGVEAVQGDIADRATVMQACAGCDAIIHTAAKAGVWGTWRDYHRANVVATSHLLEAATLHQLKAFVYTSSPSVTFAGEHQSGVDESVGYPQRWLCFYPQTKALAEQAVLQAAQSTRLPTCSLRPHLIWGEGDPHLFPRVVARAKQGKLLRIGSGENLIDVIHVDAAAQAHINALNKLLDGDLKVSGQAMFLTDGRPVSCWGWISRILELANVPVPTRSISFATAYRLGWMLEIAYATLRIKNEPRMTRFVAAQLAMDHFFNIERARQLIGFQPPADLDDRLEACRPWLQELPA